MNFFSSSNNPQTEYKNLKFISNPLKASSNEEVDIEMFDVNIIESHIVELKKA